MLHSYSGQCRTRSSFSATAGLLVIYGSHVYILVCNNVLFEILTSAINWSLTSVDSFLLSFVNKDSVRWKWLSFVMF